MKKLIVSLALLSASSVAMAEAPGGPNCGWGNLLLDGSSGLGPHLVASSVNGTSGNATFGMTLGTNGCSTDGTLTYGGDSLAFMDNIMDEYSTDVAQGSGDALNAVAVMMGVETGDREHFGKVMHENFAVLFPSETVSSEEVLNSMVALMQQDDRLSTYVV